MKQTHLRHYFTGDTLYLSDIDMINGTPVLDIKPYIPEYDSPHTRRDPGPQLHDFPTSSVPVNQKLDAGSSSDPQSKECCDEQMEDLLSEGVSADGPLSSEVGPRFPPKKHMTDMLEDIKTYLSQNDCCRVGLDNEDKVSVPPKTEPLESTVGHLSFGEDTYSTIAGWIRAPPVSSLEVRFTPHAEKELAEFLPSHMAGQSNFQCITSLPSLHKVSCELCMFIYQLHIHFWLRIVTLTTHNSSVE